MAREFTNDGVIIAQAIRDKLNTWKKKPCVFLLEDLGKEVPSLMIQQLASAEKKIIYINGSYIGAWHFAIYMRVSGEDTASRLDAFACLSECAEWLKEQDSEGRYLNLPDIGENKFPIKFELDSNPTIAARYDDGEEDYQMLMTFEYKVRRV